MDLLIEDILSYISWITWDVHIHTCTHTSEQCSAHTDWPLTGHEHLKCLQPYTHKLRKRTPPMPDFVRVCQQRHSCITGAGLVIFIRPSIEAASSIALSPSVCPSFCRKEGKESWEGKREWAWTEEGTERKKDRGKGRGTKGQRSGGSAPDKFLATPLSRPGWHRFLQRQCALHIVVHRISRQSGLERTAGQSRLHNVVTILSVPSEDIFVPAIFLLALQWT